MALNETLVALSAPGSVESSEPDTDELRPGAIVGSYVVETLIASGGCGLVYRAKHRESRQRTAIKVLHASLATVRKMLDRFAQEIEILGRLRHPHIIEIYEVGAIPKRAPYYAMEYLSGTTLDVLLCRRGRFEPYEALAILEPIVSALEAAHAEGIVHRDVKGSNIAIQGEDPQTIKLLDFGIAKLIQRDGPASNLTSAGRQIGTPSIMAPEQFLGGTVDARTDIYALGALSYRLLTGRRPFAAARPIDLVRQHLEEPPPRPSERVPLAPALDAVVLRCLEKAPERRFDDVRSFFRAFRDAVGDTPGRSSWSNEEQMAIGIHVEARIPGDAEIDDDMATEMGTILDFAESRLLEAKFLLATFSSSELFAARPLANDPEARLRERQCVLEQALCLHAALSCRPAADPRVHVNICVHVGNILIRRTEPMEIVGGPLARTRDWAPAEQLEYLGVTAEAMQDLCGFIEEDGPGGLVLITGSVDDDEPDDMSGPTLACE